MYNQLFWKCDTFFTKFLSYGAVRVPGPLLKPASRRESVRIVAILGLATGLDDQSVTWLASYLVPITRSLDAIDSQK